MTAEAGAYEVRNGVAWLTMNRPEAANALNADLRAALLAGFRRFADDDAAAVLVLTGAGTGVLGRGRPEGDGGHRAGRTPGRLRGAAGEDFPLDKPCIAAVNGVAYGGGFLLAQSCDLCVAADHARFAITEARWGRGSPWAAPLPWLIPPRVAMELVLTARPIDAARALQVGLVNQVVPGAELAGDGPGHGRGDRRQRPACRCGQARPWSMPPPGGDGKRRGRRPRALFRPAYLSDDALEGPRAFREKRPPGLAGPVTDPYRQRQIRGGP